MAIKTTLAHLVLVLLASSNLALGQEQVTTSKQETTKQGDSTKQDNSAGKSSDDSVSAEFKKKAWRALDAYNRIPATISQSDLDQSNKSLMTDADKAIDEAKYEATTSRDFKVLHALEMALLSVESQSDYPVLNPNWMKSAHRAMQCRIEATYYITPNSLSDEGKEKAKQETCNKRTSEWGDGITK